MRISGVPVGKASSVELGARQDDRRDDPARRALRADPERRARDPAPEDAARRDVRRADARAQQGGAAVPDGGRLPDGAGLRNGRAGRDLPLARPAHARTRSRSGCRRRRRASPAAGATSTTRFGNLAPFAEDGRTRGRRAQPPGGRAAAVVRQHGLVFHALSERDGQLRGLIRNSNAVFGTIATATGSCRRRSGASRRSSASRVARSPPQALRARDRPAGHRSCARPPRAVADAAATSRPRAGPPRLLRDLGPLITASAQGLPAVRADLRELRPLLGQLDPFGRQPQPVPRLHRRSTSASSTRSSATSSRRPRRRRARNGRLVHYLRTTNPLNPENLAVYPRRIGTNRPNAYAAPGTGCAARPGVPSFETRHVPRRAIPILTDEPPSPDAPPPS